MRRIVNILAKMVSAIVLALIFLPLLVALLFEIPAVQNFVAREATEIISRKLGTRISIDRVDIGLFYRVSLDGFYVEDFQRDTLLYAGRLDARIKSLGLFGGGHVQPGRIVGRPFLPARNSRRGDEHQAGGR